MPSLLTSSSYGSSDEPLAAIGPDVLLQGPPAADDQGKELDDPGPDRNRPRMAEKERVGERDRPGEADPGRGRPGGQERYEREDRKSTRLNSSHLGISYAVFCLKKKKQKNQQLILFTTYIPKQTR